MKTFLKMRKDIILVLCAALVSGAFFLASGKDDKTASTRQDRRYYSYAPPVMPHGADFGACLDCHGEAGSGAPVIPHKEIANCRQCHVPQSDVPLFRKNVFAGMPEPGKLPRAHSAAPPVIPHRVFMREKCLACHGPDSREDIVNTTHPERQNCRQCHVEQKEKGMLFRKNAGVKDAFGN